jgi:hypothetical protein
MITKRWVYVALAGLILACAGGTAAPRDGGPTVSGRVTIGGHCSPDGAVGTATDDDGAGRAVCRDHRWSR